MFNLFFDLLIFLFGSIIGSFLNCITYRLETNESFFRGRSCCPHCKHILGWQDLIPIFSFLFLKGKCRYCSQKISWQYPLVELVTGILFVFTTYNLQLTTYNLQLATYDFNLLVVSCQLSIVSYWLFVVCCLLIVFVYDLKHYIIPDKIIYPAIVIALIFNLQFSIFNQFSPKESPIGDPTGQAIFKFSILSAVGAALFFLLIVLISRGRWMGIGDIKLAFFMGLFLGFPKILFALFLAFLIGAIVGLFLIALGKKTLKSEIPFGPFLVSGTFLAMFFGQKILNWYLNLFLLK